MSWDYQSCTQLVSNVDTNNVTDMFPPYPYNYDELKAYCYTQWGAVPDPQYLHRTYNIAESSRIIFSNGLLDPWFPGGVLQSKVTQEQYSISISLAAHHLDFYGSDPAHDPQSVVDARNKEESIITQWLAEIPGDPAGTRTHARSHTHSAKARTHRLI
eukprot:TRINITY_DN180_c0_g1_i11.p1 TRINITY_DN180_c0_g1~~TRINITY_DN180_c0_g1_i11.p1  ORF type:complete len:158 (-),score=33.09 TRINITY_DN180_c0_g1_i11:106-579(-)